MGIFVSRDDAETLMMRPKLIIGLRNPGEKYENTRHNAGFMALNDKVNDWKINNKLSAIVIEQTGSPKVIFASPITFMNESGRAVMNLSNYYGINSEDILIIHDDKDIQYGDIKVKFAGSSAGHNGLNSIDNVVGEQYWRVRIGVANELLEHQDTADFVLSRFNKQELADFNKISDQVSSIIDKFISGELNNS